MEKKSNMKILSEEVLTDFAKELKYLYDKYKVLDKCNSTNTEEKDEKSCVS